MRYGHDAWISRQIGRTGLNHLVLGISTTKGANITGIRSDGSLLIHTSYSPLAAWTVALPMAAGIPFHVAVRLPVLATFNLFFISLWVFAVGQWGRGAATLTVVFSSLYPIVLFRYGLSCIFEILALGPVMAAVALFSHPRRNRGIWLAIVLASVVSVLYSWICWLIIVPCALRDVFRGYRRESIGVGLLAVAIPIAIHVTTCGLATGDSVGNMREFLIHVGQRAASVTGSGQIVTFGMVILLLLKRLTSNLGTLSCLWAAIGVTSALVAPRRAKDSFWIVLLLVFALPLNLARNISYHHDFFVILFVPIAAIASARLLWSAIALLPRNAQRIRLAAAAIAVFLAVDVAPKWRVVRPWPIDHQLELIADTIGSVIRRDDFVIANPTTCFASEDHRKALAGLREISPLSRYCGQMSQMVFVAFDTQEATQLAAQASPAQRVVIIEIGKPAWDLPPGFHQLAVQADELRIGIRDPVAVQAKTDRETFPRLFPGRSRDDVAGVRTRAIRVDPKPPSPPAWAATPSPRRGR